MSVDGNDFLEERVKEICQKIKELLSTYVQNNHADAILLSGGIDTSVISSVSNPMKAFTVTFGESPDIPYARRVAEKFGFDHHIIEITADEALEAIPTVIKILKTFDPAIPNDLAIYFGLKEAKDHGVTSVLTGDGGDELFAGYSYMHALDFDSLDIYLRNISNVMSFSSNDLGESMGIKIKQPFIDKDMIEFALNIHPSLKVKDVGDVGNEKVGKWILRKAFEADILDDIWRKKAPIEIGSGISKLRDIIGSKITDDKFEKKIKEYGMKFINKEHLYFYEIYKEVVGELQKAENGWPCPLCGVEIISKNAHCYVCGFSPPLDKQ